MSYNRRKIMRALSKHGVVIIREGGEHTVIRSLTGRQSTIPRHPRVDRHTTRGIVKQLGLDWQTIQKDIA